ncbi:DUF4286 family protein [Mycobacterium branderi]|uniref:EthD domain-containing protein n=1 Tax=Mycobacterium branderi TaxID=43348 RepID=A0A7I7WG95_9MYCO|nr:DUF4286 family protein [Mycobacterium branderi]MCV7235218.1 hypothetical protein [Mycobacterium branderi]ORA31863.1 hypothetical protein BST20_26080 [Mycobacterium branderi]BBZ14988.1 hypothetical protein MBRA_51830 [Mycobacterium branderi]
MADSLMLVFTNAVEGQDDAFNEWYDSRHLGDVLAVPGVVAAQRYELAPMKLPEGDEAPAQLPAPAHRYLAIYELDRDPDDVMKEFLGRVGSGQMDLTDSLDLSSISLATWKPSGRRRRAD